MSKFHQKKYHWRFFLISAFLLVCLLSLIARMVNLSIINRAFLLKQGNARIVRIVKIPAYRGMITDRNGQPLAVSTLVYAAWANPQIFQANYHQLATLAKYLHITPAKLKHYILREKKQHREFIYLKRGLPSSLADRVKRLNINGLFFQREYHRYYPTGPTTAHIIGFTNVDDKGQEGLELSYNDWLRGVPGKEEVLKDRLGHIAAVVKLIRKPQQGHNLVLSIDNRIQYLAYHALQEAINDNKAQSGSIVVLNVKSGGILAMVNQPSYNPNQRPKVHDGRFRNRAVTDIFEPGSTMKAFSVAAALSSGKYTPKTIIDTKPGWMVINGHTIRDDANYGIIDVSQVVQKSSNIGVARMTLSLPPQNLWKMLKKVGFGRRTESGFPGERAGSLIKHNIWKPIDLATLAFGYGISVTALQLAHAYSIIATGGIVRPVTFLKLAKVSQGRHVMSASLAREMLNILETVVQPGGTGRLAQVAGYQVAGKTGTAYIAGKHGYDEQHHRYMATFVGIAPVKHPQIVVAVIVRDPRGKYHFGGQVAAPIFAKVMGGSLRLLGVSPERKV